MLQKKKNYNRILVTTLRKTKKLIELSEVKLD